MTSKLPHFLVAALLWIAPSAIPAEKLSKEVRKKLMVDAHPTPEQLGGGWEYDRGSSKVGSSKRNFTLTEGGKSYALRVEATLEDTLAETIHHYAHYAERMVSQNPGAPVERIDGDGYEAIMVASDTDPVWQFVYLRVRAVYVKIATHASAEQTLEICKVYGKSMNANANAVLGKAAPAPAAIPPDRGRPAAADERMFKKERRSASGSSSSTSKSSRASGILGVKGRRNLAAGEDCTVRIEFKTGGQFPAGAQYRDRPYLGNLDIAVSDLWLREVPMTALGEKVRGLADKKSGSLKPLEAGGELELEIDMTGWWQLSKAGAYFIDFRWPVFDAKGKQIDEIVVPRFLMRVKGE